MRPDIKKIKGTQLFSLLSILVTSCAAPQTNQSTTTDEYYQSIEDRDSVVSDEVATVVSDEVAADGEAPSSHPAGEAPAVLVRRSPRSNGPLTGEAAGAVIYENVNQLAACYASAGNESAGRGVVYVLLDIEPQGEVTGVLVGHSDVAHTRFIECLNDELSSLTMPAATDRSVIQAHLVFGAGDEDEGREMMRSYRATRESQSEEASEPMSLTVVRSSVQGCYERVFRGHGAQGGRLVLELTLEEDGQVATVGFAEDDFDGRLDQCVTTVVGKLRLEVDEGMGTSFVYPVIISHESTDTLSETSSL